MMDLNLSVLGVNVHGYRGRTKYLSMARGLAFFCCVQLSHMHNNVHGTQEAFTVIRVHEKKGEKALARHPKARLPRIRPI